MAFDPLSRRRFLAGSASLASAAALAVGCSDDEGTTASAGGGEHGYVSFEGPHQAGIVAEAPSSLVAAFDVVDDDRDELVETFRSLSAEVRRVMSGEPYEERDPNFPPLYTGTVGNPPPPSDLSVVVSVGAGLFDDRYGLADRRPVELERMGFLANDRLDPSRSHGDVLLSISSASPEFDLFALRQLMRATRKGFVLRWMIDGYTRRTHTEPGEAGQRNLMGFLDGTANLTSDDDVLDRFVWTGGDGEPAWTAGGSYHVVRVIRMLVEFWDRVRLVEQEEIFGRHKISGAPLGGDHETDVPDYDADPNGEAIPLNAHIRLANPRTPETAGDLILRRGFSYSRGFDGSGQLDQGLAFVSFQRSLGQFRRTQERLAGEPLEEYIVPEGGGFYFALPGAADADDWLGRSLLT